MAGGPDCANAQTAGVPLLRPQTPPAASSSLANPGAGIGARRPETAALPPNPDQTLGASGVAQPLEIDDANRYRQIFDLQRQSRFREAELMMGWLNDHRLVGDVLAQRYLAGAYTASYRELASWLGRYGDHPQALRLYKLALKRRPAGAALPRQTGGRGLSWPARPMAVPGHPIPIGSPAFPPGAPAISPLRQRNSNRRPRPRIAAIGKCRPQHIGPRALI